MAIYTTLRVVDKTTGATILNVDETGIKDAASSVFSGTQIIRDRLFATPLAAYMWTCLEGTWRVIAVNAKYSVVGGAGATVDVLVSPGVTAPAGTTQLTAPIALTATAPASVNGTLITTPTLILPGDSLSRVIGGTPGSLEGILTVQIRRIG